MKESPPPNNEKSSKVIYGNPINQFHNIPNNYNTGGTYTNNYVSSSGQNPYHSTNHSSYYSHYSKPSNDVRNDYFAYSPPIQQQPYQTSGFNAYQQDHAASPQYFNSTPFNYEKPSFYGVDMPQDTKPSGNVASVQNGEVASSPDDSKYFSADTETKIRHAFIRKVYSILLVELLLTFGIISYFVYNTNAKYFLQTSITPLFISLAVFIVAVIMLSCCVSLARSFPTNYILLTVISCAQAVFISYLAIKVSKEAYIFSIAITSVVVISLTLFAWQTKIDFTACTTFLLVSGIIFTFLILFGIFFKDHIFHLVLCGIGVCLMCFYLVYDTQQIIGGKRRQNQIGIDDYAYGVLALYLDIVMIFFYILSLGFDTES